MSQDIPRKARKVPGKKLLIASIGVAAVSYACSETKRPEVVGNLVAPITIPDASTAQPTADAGAAKKPSDDIVTSGNLVAPMPADAGPPKPMPAPEIVGNLMAPQPRPADAGTPPKPPKK